MERGWTGGAALIALSLAVALAGGTRPTDVWNGMVVISVRFPQLFAWPVNINPAADVWAVLSLAAILLVHGILKAQIDNQNSRNALLKTEIAKLDEQIKEIDRLREQIQAVISRKQVVETLQANRSEAVHLLDQLVRQLPDGVYLRSIKQAGPKVTLVGYAQSNARVSTLMRNIEETARRLLAIKELGVRIAIDDFGTGYSSLAHLQRFPVDALKIDRSFISGMRHNKEGETLIHTLVQLGKALSIDTVAEGIEEQQELTLLRQEECDSGQGFLFARPLDVAGTEAFLQRWARNAAPAVAPPRQTA